MQSYVFGKHLLQVTRFDIKVFVGLADFQLQETGEIAMQPRHPVLVDRDFQGRVGDTSDWLVIFRRGPPLRGLTSLAPLDRIRTRLRTPRGSLGRRPVDRS